MEWWQTGVIYQIYPRSFQDSNRDGVGDLAGIIRRLDYLNNTLGVDAIWLTPIYPSPMADFGYDVADYCAIHPLFGGMQEFDTLLGETHRRGMKLILDLVPNHTSSEHAWFKESRSSRDNPRRDWYIWQAPGPGGGAPNNWLSYFGGSAWTYDEKTAQYYLHQFLSQQPELNYRNPQVVEALHKNMRFWLDKGVDGFRVDVIWLMMKDPLFRNEPPNPAWDGVVPLDSLEHIYTADMPEVHELIRGMRAVLEEYDDRMMVGEIYLPTEKLVQYYGRPEALECHLPFNFQLISAQWRAETIRRMVNSYETALPDFAWPNWVLGNHDRHRIASRVGPAQTGVAAMLLLTLRGTPTCYYGDELGMENVAIPLELLQDPGALNQPEVAHLFGRDPVRTPMQWDDSPHAGFSPSAATPWLPLAENYREVNVARQLARPDSLLNLYRRLLAFRKTSSALQTGVYLPIELTAAQDHCFAYQRQSEDQRILVALNFSDQEQRLDWAYTGSGEIVLSTGLDRQGQVELANFYLRPNEGCIILLQGAAFLTGLQ